ncbi:MAG: hypothetical protein NVS1B10_00380 [Candidatus Saccharimonadales bacterium]
MFKLLPKDSVLVPESATKMFSGQIFDVYQWPQKMFDGSIETFEMLKRADTVAAICIVDNNILVIDDQQPHRGVRKSFPCGRVDQADDSIVAAAQREIKEETGYSFKNWRLIKVSQAHSKIEGFSHVFLATDILDKTQPYLDPGEKIELHYLSFSETRNLVMSGVDYLKYSQDIFQKLESLEQLLNMAEFTGIQADR